MSFISPVLGFFKDLSSLPASSSRVGLLTNMVGKAGEVVWGYATGKGNVTAKVVAAEAAVMGLADGASHVAGESGKVLTASLLQNNPEFTTQFTLVTILEACVKAGVSLPAELGVAVGTYVLSELLKPSIQAVIYSGAGLVAKVGAYTFLNNMGSAGAKSVYGANSMGIPASTMPVKTISAG